MIIIDDLGINISVKYIGNNIADCKEFISYMITIGARKKPKVPDWIVSKDHFEDIKSKFEYTIKINPWDSIGSHMKLQPYPYQKEAIYYALNNPNSLLILPTGSGKTCIGAGIVLEYNIEEPIIICTKASLKHNWLQEINKFTDLPANIIDTPSKAGKRFNKQFENCRIYILNYETLRNDQVYDKLREHNVCGIIFDEVQAIGNHKSARTKAALRFKDLDLKIGLTATPITNNPLNLFSIFNMLKPDIYVSYSKFSNRYIVWRNKRPAYAKNVEEMIDKVKPYIFKKDESDIAGQLPELYVMEPTICTMTQNMREINDIINSNIDELNSVLNKLDRQGVEETDERWIKAQNNLQAYQTYAQELADDIRLLQTDSTFTKDFDIYDTTNPKLEALINIIEPIIESDNKVCIFTRYERMQHIIVETIKNTFNIKCAYVNGSMSSEEKYEIAIRQFDTGDVNVLVATDAIKEGISLSHCKYLVEYEPANSYADQTQRRGRVKRANSISRISYIYQLITDETWDIIALKSINKKKGYADYLDKL